MALRSRCLVLAALLVVAAPSVSFALSAPDGLEALDERDQEVLEAIASRAPERREAALAASQYPDTLVRIELIQARSSAAFDLRMKRLDREHQEEFWELVRTPGLLSELTTDGPKSKRALAEIAAQQPETVRDAISHLGGEHFALLEEAEAIKASADIAFGEEIATLPPSSRQAFEQLLEDPELLAMLGRSPSAVVAIGESFEADPEATRARFDELAVEVAAANAAVEEEWRESIEGDPEAREELEQAAREYSDEYGYDYDELTDERVHVTVRHYYSPYPYWFGYPSWYAHWYPWGWWYPVYPHFGFYYGHRDHYVYFGLPSLHFVHWFYGGHHHRYRHVSRYFDHGHHRHHRSSHAVYRTVRHHDRHAGWRSHRSGRPDGISSRSFRKRDGRRVWSGTRRGEFRRRTERLPDSTFGRRDAASRGDFWRAGRGRDRAGVRSATEAGRVEGQPRVDAPRRDRSGVERSGQRGPRDRARVARPDVSRPDVSRPRVARREGQRSPARVDRAPARSERNAPGVQRGTRRVEREGGQRPAPQAAPRRESAPGPSGAMQRSPRRERLSSSAPPVSSGAMQRSPRRERISSSPPVSSGPRASSGRSRSGPRLGASGGARGGGRAVQRGGGRGGGRGIAGGGRGGRGGGAMRGGRR